MINKHKLNTVIAVASAAAAIALFINSGRWLNNAALASAAVGLPQGSLRLVRNYLSAPAETHVSDVEIVSEPPAADSAAVQKVFSLTAVPSDIALLMEEATEEFANQKKDGDIMEITYKKDGATHSYGNVIVRNKTSTKSLDIKNTLSEEINLSIDREKPAVLIFHTHTTEGYEILDRGWYASDYSSRTQNINKSIVRVGTAIEEALTNEGFIVIHDTTLHDTKYSGAYDRSRQTVQKYLDKYPNIKVVLDIHRDAIHRDDGTKIKPTAVINGKKSAQIMIITGAEENNVKDFPNWEQNLRFALKLQKSCEDNFPSLMRPVFFCARKYTMDMTPCDLLIEMGSDANTLDEAVYAGKLFGTALAKLLNNYVA